MVCREIIDILERACPKEYALEWDNVGLLAFLGSESVHSKKITMTHPDHGWNPLSKSAIARGSL